MFRIHDYHHRKSRRTYWRTSAEYGRLLPVLRRGALRRMESVVGRFLRDVKNGAKRQTAKPRFLTSRRGFASTSV